MAIRLEEYNKNQRVYNRSQNENRYNDFNGKNESSLNTTQRVPESQNTSQKIPESQNTTRKVPENQGKTWKIPENLDKTQYIRVNESQNATQNVSQNIMQDNSEDYNNWMVSRTGANFTKQKGGHLRKIKAFYCIIAILLFLFTPFLITISMTGVIESDISDSLVEVRRVNVKYKGGSQAMDISKYMIGVLASRLSMSSEIEVLKAESIMIRTEIYRCMGDEMTIDSTNLNLTYLSDKELKSLWGDSYSDNYNLIVDCISTTSGMLINCNGQLIEPMYHEVSVGKTRNATQVFNGSASDYSYMTSVVCEHDIEAKDYLAVKSFTYDDFIKPFSDKYGNVNISKDNPGESVQIVSRCSADYVLKIQAGNALMTGEEFAKILGLNSSCFWMETANNSIKITTKGKGNGLGVSIYTADYMAKNGSTCEEILNKFYSNITIMSE